MSKRLQDLISNALIERGPAAKVEMCAAIERSEQTLNRWMREGIPSAHEAYRLALACGCTKEEALKLAKEECPSEEAREA